MRMCHRSRFQEFLTDFTSDVAQKFDEKKNEDKDKHIDVIEVYILQRGSITKV
jgi:hypothetical protein